MAERPVVLVAAQPVVRRLVTAALRPRGFEVRGTSEHGLATDAISEVQPDVVLVEADPGLDAAVAELQHLVEMPTPPVIVMSGNATASGAIDALDAGAADYVARPFDPTELAARVRSLVRRRGARLATGKRRVGAATVDLERRVVLRDGAVVPLARSEWRILMRLLAADGEVVPHDELLASAFGWEAIGDTAPLQAAIARLRRKIGAGPHDPGPIRAVRGFGYRLVSDGVA